MIKFIDPDHPFYRPLWVRLLIIGFCTGWTVIEFLNGATTWGMIFLAVSAYTTCVLLIFFKPKPLVDDGPAAEATTAQETKADDPL